jgi:hypothetical protein
MVRDARIPARKAKPEATAAGWRHRSCDSAQRVWPDCDNEPVAATPKKDPMTSRKPPATTSVHVGAQRTAPYKAMILSGVTTPVEMMIASCDLLAARQQLPRQGDIPDSWGTSGVYVLVGEHRSNLGPGTSIAKYDHALGRGPSNPPPREETDIKRTNEKHQHTDQWRHRFYTGMTRNLLRRVDEHAAKPWWNRALLCRRAAPFPYDIAAIGYLEGRLHETLDAAFWLRREGRASYEAHIHSDPRTILENADLPSILLGVRMLGLPLDTVADVNRLGAAPLKGAP